MRNDTKPGSVLSDTQQTANFKRESRVSWLWAIAIVLVLLLAWTIFKHSVRMSQWPQKLSFGSYVGPIAFSPDGKLLVVGANNYPAKVEVWEVAQSDLLHTIKTGHDHGVGLIAISADGKLLVTCSVEDDKRLILWDVQTGHRVGQLESELDSAHSLFFSRDGTLLIDAGNGRSGIIEVWDVRKQQLLYRVTNPRDDVFAAVMPDDKSFVTISSDGIKLRDLRSGALVRVLSGSGQECVQAVLSPDGQTLALGTRVIQGQTENIELWDIQSAKLRLTLLENRGAPWGSALKSLAFSMGGKLLASSSIDPQTGEGTIRVRDAQTGHVLHTIQAAARSLAFSPDGKTLAVATRDEVQLWKVDALLSQSNS